MRLPGQLLDGEPTTNSSRQLSRMILVALVVIRTARRGCGRLVTMPGRTLGGLHPKTKPCAVVDVGPPVSRSRKPRKMTDECGIGATHHSYDDAGKGLEAGVTNQRSLLV